MRDTALLTRVCCLSLLVWLTLRGQDVTVTTLKQTGSFTLPSNPSRISRIVSGGGVLWFVVANGNWTELLATDFAGGNPNQFAIRPPTTKGVRFPTNAICASTDGRIAVGRAEGTFEIYSRVGELVKTISAEQQASQCGFDQTLWVWSGTGLDAVDGASVGLHIESPLLPKYAQVDLLGLEDHSVSLLESTEAVLYVVDQQTGKWQRHPLAAPEFQPRQLCACLPVAF